MREKSIDSAKFVLVCLVVAGHLVEVSRGANPALNALYRFIYVFHVPALAYVSGIVASATIGSGQARRWLSVLLLPYLVFQALYNWQTSVLTGGAWSLLPTNPNWLLWYLLSLATWRVLLPPIMTTRWPIVIAVLVALAVGLSTGINSAYSASRTLVFFPFFVAGHLLGMPGRPRAWRGLLGLAAIGWLAWVYREFPILWLYGSTPYEQIKATGATVGADPIAGTVIRAAVMAVGAVGVWSILQLVPAADSRTAWLGQQSLGAYLLHGFLVKWAVAAGWIAVMVSWSVPWRFAAVLGIGVLATALLAATGRYLRWAMDYEWLWGLGRQRVAASPTRAHDAA